MVKSLLLIVCLISLNLCASEKSAHKTAKETVAAAAIGAGAQQLQKASDDKAKLELRERSESVRQFIPLVVDLGGETHHTPQDWIDETLKSFNSVYQTYCKDEAANKLRKEFPRDPKILLAWAKFKRAKPDVYFSYYRECYISHSKTSIIGVLPSKEELKKNYCSAALFANGTYRFSVQHPALKAAIESFRETIASVHTTAKK